VMHDGRVQQVGTPLQVYARPANRFVAGFIGAPAMNFLEVTVGSEGGQLLAEAPQLRLAVCEPSANALATRPGGRAIIGIRPEHLLLGEGAPGRSFEATVEVVEQLGSEILLETRVGGSKITVARIAAETPVAAGDRVRLSVQPGRLHFFDPDSEAAIA